MTYNCVVVDNDKMSRLVVRKFINKTHFLTLKYDIDNVKDASEILSGQNDEEVDIIFMDTEMPGMTGLDFVRSLPNTYNVVMIAAKKKYAVEAFERAVADYLIKPIAYDRFLKAVNRVISNIKKEKLFKTFNDHIYIRSNRKMIRLGYDQILFIEALSDYVIFNTRTSKHIVRHTMKGMEKRLPENTFSRVHRSYIVNLNKVSKIDDLQVYIDDRPFAIGASYKGALLKKFNPL